MGAGAVLTTVGKGLVTGALVAGTIAEYGTWGTGSGTAGVSDTAMFDESSESRQVGSLSQQTTSVTNDTYQNQFTMTASAGRDITEVGTFSASTSGSIMVHATFASAYDLSEGDSITFKVQTQFT